MKRREEIIDAGIEYTLQNRPMCMGGDSFFEEMREMNRNKSFEEGAKWADKTMIEKACEYLESSLKHDLGYYGAADFANTFRKAMEE